MKNFLKKSIPWFVLVLFVFGAYYLFFKYATQFIIWADLNFAEVKTVGDLLQSVVQVFAVIIAGYWTYNQFIKGRGDYPFPKIEHQIKHWDLENGYFFVRVYVIVENKGKVKHDLSKGAIYVRQVKPCKDRSEINRLIKNSGTTDLRNGLVDGLFMEHELHKIAWPELGYRDFFLGGQEGKTISLEPAQTKIFPFDFLVEDGITHIEVISYLDNQKRETNCLTDPPTSTIHFLRICSE